MNNQNNSSNEFKFFKATYVNPYPDEHKEHLSGETIKEEDEDIENFEEDFKEVLRIKYRIFMAVGVIL